MAGEIEDWLRVVDSIMRAEYMISAEDIGLSQDEIDRFFEFEPNPKSFAIWFARKYDLDHA